METEAIKPCIFCKKEQDADSFYYNGSGPPPAYAVECGYCGARGSSGLGMGRDDHEGAKRAAVREWNRAHAEAEHTRSFYGSRMDALQQYQKRLPEPHRTAVCNILANGTVSATGKDVGAAPEELHRAARRPEGE